MCSVDMKKIVAYSSIAHMNYALLVFLRFSLKVFWEWRF